MDHTPPSTGTRAQAEFLLKEQRYDEALSMLSELIERDPSASEVRIYRVLVARILMLQHYSPTRYGSLEALLREFGRRLLLRAFLVQFRSDQLKLSGPVGESFADTPSVGVDGGIGRRAARTIAGGAMIAVMSLYFAGVGQKSAPLPVEVNRSSGHDVTANAKEPARIERLAVATIDSPESERGEEGALQITPGSRRPDITESDLDTRAENTQAVVKTAPADADAPPVKSASIVAKAVLDDKQADTVRQDHRVTLSHRRQIFNGAGADRVVRRAMTNGLDLPYESKQKVAIRESASFAAAPVQKIERGTAVNLVELQGSWAKVSIGEEGITGFVRKEFLTPARALHP